MLKIKSFIIYTVLFYLLLLSVSNAAIIPTDPENPEKTGWRDENAYRPNPVLFQHGFASGSNYDWNPNPNAPNQAEEQKKATAVLKDKFDDYFPITPFALREWTQVPYLETIEFFNKYDDREKKIRDRNSSIDDYQVGDYYVKKGWRNPGDPGLGDKVARVITGGGGPPYERLYYLLSPDQTGFIQNKYKAPSGSDKDVKVKIVAHSMGGLAAREYLTGHDYTDANKTVDKLITIGTPHLGSHWATLGNAITNTVDTVGILALPLRGPLTWIWGKAVVEIGDLAVENFYWIDIDGDAENDMDLRFGSGYLREFNSRSHPKGVRYYVIYGTHPTMGVIESIAIRELIYELRSRGVSLEDIEEILKEDYDMEIGLVEMVTNSIGDGVVPLNSQRGWDKKNGKRVFELAREERIIVGHGKEPVVAVDGGNTSPLFRMLDDTKPVIEITEVNNVQNRVLWRVGQWPEYFEVPTDGIIKVHGLCRKEYLPADTFINIGFRKAGQTDVNWITESGGLTTDQSQAQQWLLQPSDLWIASNPDSPVAEFEVEIDFPIQEVTHSIIVQAINPAGIKSDPVEVSEKTHYIYTVGKDNNGEGVLQCLDGPTSFVDEIGAVVSEFNLVDEAGNKISARPLDITTDRSDAWAQNIWISFDNKRIYCYDISTMEPKQLAGGQHYYTTTAIPDGLYYESDYLYYSSSSYNKLYRITVNTGAEEDRGVISKRLSIDEVVTDNLYVNYTTQEYEGYSPTGISKNFLSSFSKINKRHSSSNFIQTVPINTPVWANEQDTPAPCVGITEVTDSSVPEGYTIYLSCTDGDVYKCRLEDKKITGPLSETLQSIYKEIYTTFPLEVFYYSYTFSFIHLKKGRGRIEDSFGLRHATWNSRSYHKITPPQSFIEAKVVSKAAFHRIQNTWGGIYWLTSIYPGTVAPTTFNVCTFDESWAPEQKYNNPVLSTLLWVQPYDGMGISYDEVSPKIRVRDVTSIIPTNTFYYTGRYSDESQYLPVGPEPFPTSPPLGYVGAILISNTPWLGAHWLFLTDNGSLETLGQFRTSIPIAEGITTGPRVKIRIEHETLRLVVGQTGQLKVNGKAPYAWESGDETVCVIEGDGETVTVKAVGMGTSTISVRDALSNIAYAMVTVL